MAAETIISVKNVSKDFRLPSEKHMGIKQAFINFRPSKKNYEVQHALQNITFDIKKGEFFGIIGRNGSGKSTLLKLLAQIYTPEKGSIDVGGSLTPFIELGVGFNPELTGRENVYLNGALLGFDNKQMDAMYDDIVSFAEIKPFMDQKLKNYSSGMQVRLAFSIAIRSEADILLVDEVLAVGDASFQQKCYDYFQSLKHSDTTVVFVSHDLRAIETFCDRTLLISKGTAVYNGPAEETTVVYRQLLASGDDSKISKPSHRQVNPDVKITGAKLLNSGGQAVTEIKEGESFTFRVFFKANTKLHNPVFGIGVMNSENNSIIGPNTKESGFKTNTIEGVGHVDAKFADNIIATGSYHLQAAVFDESGEVPYDFAINLMGFNIKGTKRHGFAYVSPVWSVESKKGQQKT